MLQARSANTNLSYDFILLKTIGTEASPLIIDTDGELRWRGTSGSSAGSLASLFYENGVYIGVGSSILRMELDGAITLNRDPSSAGVTGFHHNIDRGRDGLILDVSTATAVESVDFEIDMNGNVLHT